jgi:hypothetical protein
MNKHTNKYINKQNRAEGAGAGDSWRNVQFMRPWVPSPPLEDSQKKELLNLLSALFSI